MTSRAAIFALLSLWGVGAAITPVAAQETPTEIEAEAEADGLVNRVWVRSGESTDLPGIIKIFLSDGTLVQDSCWETHRLSEWQRDGDAAVTWNEDGMDIRAAIVTLNADELVLRIDAVGSEERYTPAVIPYVCPDMPKG